METKLYELAADYQAVTDLMARAEAAEGTEADDLFDLHQALADTLEGIKGSIEEKTGNIGKLMRAWEADNEAIDTEIKRLQARKRARANRIEALREYLRHNMEATGISKIESPIITATLTKSRPMAVIDDERQLPEKFVKVVTTRSPMKAEILKALKAGENVPGAKLGESKPGLMIR